MDVELSFGQWLQRRRLAGHLTQRQLAELARCSADTIRKLEADERRPSPELTRHLATALGIVGPDHDVFLRFARSGLADAPPLPNEPARPRPMQPPSNLPVLPAPLFGRQSETTAVRALLLDDVRLVTLTGPGGVGKTSLAIAVAATLRDAFADGTVFVNLAPLADPEMVLATIAQALEVKERSAQPLLATVQTHLRDRQLLLLLDNFEQVLAAGLVVADLLRAAPMLRVLVTSREPLHLRGEHEVAVGPLPLPRAGIDDLAVLSQYDAVRLFIARARAVKLDFQVTNASAPAVAEICVRLDGLPLAIELAAVRSKLLAPEALLQRLGNRLQFLTGGPRDLPARQQTIRATIDWSYNLLEPAEQALFRRLAVFTGGWTIEAAEAVAAMGNSVFGDVFDGLQSLVDKNLVVQDLDTNGVPRFTMLETLREYALDRLTAAGEAVTATDRHLAFFLQYAEEAATQDAAHARLAREQDNLRAALERAFHGSHLPAAIRLLHATVPFWMGQGRFTEWRSWLGRAVMSDVPVPVLLRAQTLHWAAQVALFQGDMSARTRELAAECRTLYQAAGDIPGEAGALGLLGEIARNTGDYPLAMTMLEQALALYRQVDDQWRIALMSNNLGATAIFQGDYERARTILEQNLARQQERGNEMGMASALLGLAEIELAQAEYQRAAESITRSVTLFRRADFALLLAWALHLAGYVADHLGDAAQARENFHESMRLMQSGDTLDGVAVCLAGCARVACSDGDLERAARLLAAGEALAASIGGLFFPTYRLEQPRTVAATRAALDQEALAKAWAEGVAMTLEQAIAYALSDET